ncbi:uncharacterized protein BYT42DRAFT_575046 [Radiomyces spectabilis]|uniref:uncharacterized protein n=1 Tax=Radiomyces spectabilis TaxID=64574 RepID=UPI00221F173B|nr:uncharacterized protein BYT42DRAFT_575046 [Radiomyces spectabilis]KAI8376558.1 hypothetical protein BYT42DRAFT_575046 [Radiomyces spectabilis]
MEPEIPASLETIIEEQIQDRDDIADIGRTLHECLKLDLDLSFCFRLLEKIIYHAADAQGFSKDTIHEYSLTISKLIIYIADSDPKLTRKLLNDYVHLLKELLNAVNSDISQDIKKLDMHIELSMGSNSTLDLSHLNLESDIHVTLRLLSIVIRSLASVAETTFILFGDVFRRNSSLLPYMLDMKVSPANPVYLILTESCSHLIKTMIIHQLIDIQNCHAENILVRWLSDIDQLSSYQQQPDVRDLLEELTLSLHLFLETFPTLDIIDHIDILSSIYDTLLSDPHRALPLDFQECMLKLASLLLRNHIIPPHLKSYLDRFDENDDHLQVLAIHIRQLLDAASLKDDQLMLHSVYSNPAELDKHMSDENSQRVSDTLLALVPETVPSIGDGDNGIVAVIKLKTIAKVTQVKMTELLLPFERELAQLAVYYLTVDPIILQNIASLYDMKVHSYLASKMGYVLPYALAASQDNDAIEELARVFGLTPTALCDQEGFYIFVDLFLSHDQNYADNGFSHIKRLYNTPNAITTLLKKHKTKVTSLLAMEFGEPFKKDKVLEALQSVIDLMQPKEPLTPTRLLSRFFLAILDRVGNFITEERLGSRKTSHPYTLDALMEIMRIVGPDIRSHVLQLMSILHSVGDLPSRVDEALRLWSLLIDILPAADLLIHMTAIVSGLLDLFALCDRTNKDRLATLLRDLVLEKVDLTSSVLERLPKIPDVEELAPVKSYIDTAREEVTLDQAIPAIIQQAYQGGALETLSALEQLHQLFKDHGTLSDTVAKYQSELYSLLLEMSRKRMENDKIRKVAALCLGLLGARDPSLLDIHMAETSMILLQNFTDKNENRDFICNLIKHHLVPAFHASSNELVHQCLQYTLQELLKQANFVIILEGASVNPNVQHHWMQFPAAVQTMLTPLLSSSFECKWDFSAPASPIYPTCQSFTEWMTIWYNTLVEQARGDAKSLFSACIPSIKSGHLGLAIYLQPYLVLHVLLAGTSKQRDNIIMELKTVLNTNSQASSRSENMAQASFQATVRITEHCRKWIHRRRAATQNSVSKKEIALIQSFLMEIPNELMAMASFRSRAYAQALMHLETYVSETFQNQDDIPSAILRNLRQSYAQLDDKDDMQAIFVLLKGELTLEEEILQFQSLGYLDKAKVCYEELLSRHPDDLSKHTDYINCLRISDNFETVSLMVNHYIERRPEWLPQLNVYRAEAAWKLGDWSALERYSQVPMGKTFEAYLASALANLRKNRMLAFFCDLEQARQEQLEYLSTSSMESYQKSLEHILQLQILQELEDSQVAWERSLRVQDKQPMRDLCSNWDRQISLAPPSYALQKNIFKLRQTVLFSLRPSHATLNGNTLDLSVDGGSFWLLKARKARKSGDMPDALHALLKAEALDTPEAYLERARWYWANDECIKALAVLQNRRDLTPQAMLLKAKYSEELMVEQKIVHTIFREVTKRNPTWEKAFFRLGKFFDNAMAKSNDSPQKKIVGYSSHIVGFYVRALKMGSKYYYYTMPRLITVWFQVADLMDKYMAAKSSSPNLEKTYNNVNKMMEQYSQQIPLYQFISVLPRLISRLVKENETIAAIIRDIIIRVFNAYPQTTVWALQGPYDSANMLLQKRCREILARIEAKKPETSPIKKIIRHAQQFTAALKELAREPFEDNVREVELSAFPGISKIRNLAISVPIEKTLIPSLPEHSSSGHMPFPDDLPTVAGFGKYVQVMHSLQKPKTITILGSDGKRYKFLCKRNDDLRRDARVMEFCTMINKFLKHDTEARQKELYIRTYAIIPLGERWGLLQWIENLQTLKSIVCTYWQKQGLDPKLIFGIAKTGLTSKNVNELDAAFRRDILPRSPPVFYKWFVENFPEPSEWLASRKRYTKTLAVMSILGYILGLGDRHAENILFDTSNGDCVHVDVNMLFEKGVKLAVPEIVPFRLTHNMTHAMGTVRTNGNFRRSFELTLQVLRANKTQLMSVFETLIYDHVNEVSPRGDISSNDISSQVAKMEAKIDSGLGIKEQAQKLIDEASSPRNLCRMYIGWAPFI